MTRLDDVAIRDCVSRAIARLQDPQLLHLLRDPAEGLDPEPAGPDDDLPSKTRLDIVYCSTTLSYNVKRRLI